MNVDDTKAVILQALTTLSERESLDRISIGDVALEANISRQTFYYHFDNLLSVITWAIASERDFKNTDIVGPSQTMERMYDWACAIERNRRLIKAALFSRDAPELEKIFHSENKRIAIPIVMSIMSDRSDSERDISASFLAYAYVGMICKWVREDSPLSMLDVHIQLCKMMRRVLKPTLYNATIGDWAERHYPR